MPRCATDSTNPLPYGLHMDPYELERLRLIEHAERETLVSLASGLL